MNSDALLETLPRPRCKHIGESGKECGHLISSRDGRCCICRRTQEETEMEQEARVSIIQAVPEEDETALYWQRMGED